MELLWLDKNEKMNAIQSRISLVWRSNTRKDWTLIPFVILLFVFSTLGCKSDLKTENNFKQMYLSEKLGLGVWDTLNFKRTKFYVDDLKEFETKLLDIYNSNDIIRVKELYNSVLNKIENNGGQYELRELCEDNISDIEHGEIDFDMSLIFNVWDDLRYHFAGIEVLDDKSMSKFEYESMLVYNNFPIGEADKDDEFNFIFTYEDGEKLNSKKTIVLYELMW